MHFNELKEQFPEFFDEESGNNSHEGLNQVKEYIKEEQIQLEKELKKVKIDIEKVKNPSKEFNLKRKGPDLSKDD